MKPFFIILTILVSVVSCKVIVLPDPYHNNTATTTTQNTTKVIVYFPGANVPNTEYIPLINAIQRENHGSTTPDAAIVGLLLHYPKVFVQIPPFLQTQQQVDKALQQFKVQFGYLPSYENVILAGHSLGGVLAQSVAMKATKNGSSLYGGLLLHGSFLQKKNVKRSGPPVVTISGSLDGLNRMSYLATQYQQQDNVEELQRNPVLILHGVNHRHICNGFTNKFLEDNDVDSSLSVPDAITEIAKKSLLILTKEMSFKKWQQDTLVSFIKPILTALEADMSGETCAQSQREISDNNIIAKSRVYLNAAAFALTSPTVKTKNDNTTVTIITDTYVGMAVNPVGTSLTPNTVQTLRCKLKSFRKPSSCASLNEATVQRVLRSLNKSSTSIISMEEDVVKSTSFSWMLSDISLVKKNSVTSTQYQHGTNFYCSLLSASRAIDYILLDQYKKV